MTPQERTQLVDKLLAGIEPANPPKTPLAERIRAWRSQFRRYRVKGYTWKQLVEIAKFPKIGITTTASSLTRIVGSKEGRTADDGLTAEQRDAIFAEATQNMKPERPPASDVVLALREWEEPLRAKAAAGFSDQQIVKHVIPDLPDIRYVVNERHIKLLLRSRKKAEARESKPTRSRKVKPVPPEPAEGPTNTPKEN